MSVELLAPGVPATIADLYANHEIEWETGWGDYKTHTCLHGALLRPCAVPGDEIMWSVLLSSRGLTTGWNDEQSSVDPIVERLREQGDPDEAEMVVVFGPQWEACRWVCRTYAAATDEQKKAAWAAWAAWDAWDAWDARAAWAAWDARAAWDAWDARDAWAAWDARDARDAWAAFLAVGAYGVITPEQYGRLTAAFEGVFGTIPLKVA